jgi:hypothetical protein
MMKNTKTSSKDSSKFPPTFAGNKSFLPQKPCLVCARPMTWRKKWEKNWDEVKYCSDRCRANAKQQN